MLRCECGGVVELTNNPEGPPPVVEKYECVSCGDTGTVFFGSHDSHRSGCLVTETTEPRL